MAYSTNKSLLEKIRNEDEISWLEFYETYRPLIILCGGDYHLTAVEKEELVQLVLLEIFRTCNSFRYDRSKGRFRAYLRKIICGKAIDLIRKRRDDLILERNLEEYPDENPLLEQVWLGEWTSFVLVQALEVLRTKIEPITYQAFELHVMEETPAAEVAKFLGIKINMVYVAKSRAISKLRTIIDNLEE